MSERTLFIEIFQPFAQYRNPFTFYYAQSYPLPPKSTVIGMLQNAVNDYYGHKLGIENWWRLEISIHGGFESVFWNYQQLIKEYVYVEVDKNLKIVNQGKTLYNEGVKSQRTPVYQQELFNGRLYLFVKGEKKLVDEIHSALVEPKKILSLGRSEDVAYIRHLEFVSGEQKEAKKSVWLEYPTYIRKEISQRNGKRREFPTKNQKYPVYSIPLCVQFSNDGIPVKNKAEITKKTERKVRFETVIYTGFDYVIKLSENITYDEFQVNGKKFRIIHDFGWL